ncbi:nidogen-like domain-containing protein [Microcella sp.]|uniref:nidogen-like domain-containing protein n=1 Tax=Microcella sp. TaxID=1913979 RepID=UPI00255E2B8F|nr:nidogen-like domain-containing protein [Microcella sp.]MBX9472871.1 hypothetical protein [Microcella sp.]
MHKLTLVRRGAAALIAAAILVTTAAPAMASVNTRDESDAMRYGASAPLGSVISELSGQDDDTHTIAAPWPLNFFGDKFDGICITTNGGVYPVATSTSTCSDAYDLDLENLAIDSEAPMIAVLAADINLSRCDSARATQRSGAGDGFGRPCEMYLDTAATIDGREAVVVTWYRVSNHEDQNDPLLENTFQLALIKLPTTDGATNGFDFDLEFNYGTVTDFDDGYSAADPTGGCIPLPEGNPDCRWGIGIASYDSGVVSTNPPAETEEPATEPEPEATEPATPEASTTDSSMTQAAVTEASTFEAAASAVGYEFFAPTEVLNMMDEGATPLIANSLGTDVLGRYTCGMVNGAAVGCDPVSMQAPGAELAETGADESTIALVAAAMVLALAVMVTGATMVRRPARRVASNV